jgi:hypothetical protein
VVKENLRGDSVAIPDQTGPDLSTNAKSLSTACVPQSHSTSRRTRCACIFFLASLLTIVCSYKGGKDIVRNILSLVRL